MKRTCAVAMVYVMVAMNVAGAYAGTLIGQGKDDIFDISNRTYRLTIRRVGDELRMRLYDVAADFVWTNGPYLYRAEREIDGKKISYEGLKSVTIRQSGNSIQIEGELAGIRLQHTFELPVDKPFMEERLVLHNPGDAKVALTDFETGFQRLVADKTGNVLPDLVEDRLVAIPFRHRPDDLKHQVNDFSMSDIVTNPGYEQISQSNLWYRRIPSRHRFSEAWSWKHGDHSLGLFCFNQEYMNFSVISKRSTNEGVSLRFGGSCMLMGEPADLTRISPGQTLNLGLMRYQTLKGDYAEVFYAYRKMLDEKGCRFPKDFDPPVHWNQLYEMGGAWNDRANKYTKAIIEKEAAKARDYSCQSLYLDPGWDTLFGSFIWGEQWLGNRKQFIQEMKSKYGLNVSLHCPLATWISIGLPMGPEAIESWPKKAARTDAPGASSATDGDDKFVMVPAIRDGHRNLSRLPKAKPNASSVISNVAVNQIAHLNDGWYTGLASWVAASTPAWAEIDLGQPYAISKVRLTNDLTLESNDRIITKLRILGATKYNADSDVNTWKTLVEYQGKGLLGEGRDFTFEPTVARWVRVDILDTISHEGPRLDEIEIYDAQLTAEKDIASVESNTNRQEPAAVAARNKLKVALCLGSKQYMDEAEKRLLALCADGVVFLMYDGNWWNNGCYNSDHGHPIPYLREDHIRANLDLAQRIHKKYPNVLIEMHDMLSGGSRHRMTPVYYKYGLPGSYDENWGFELMWSPMEDIKTERALALYYYNMGCNVPIYLHVDLRTDNEHCLVLWWYASTCRHLGIGGVHPNPKIAQAHKDAMKRYRSLERFYKRGEFYGIDEGIHLHIMPQENSFVVNLFNLSDEPRTVEGSVSIKQLGIDPNCRYVSDGHIGKVDEQGLFSVSYHLPPWGTEVAVISRNP